MNTDEIINGIDGLLDLELHGFAANLVFAISMYDYNIDEFRDTFCELSKDSELSSHQKRFVYEVLENLE